MNAKLKNTITEGVLTSTEMYEGTMIGAPKIYGYIEHKPTMSKSPCYKPIGWFKRLMLKWCFDLEYKKI